MGTISVSLFLRRNRIPPASSSTPRFMLINFVFLVQSDLWRTSIILPRDSHQIRNSNWFSRAQISLCRASSTNKFIPNPTRFRTKTKQQNFQHNAINFTSSKFRMEIKSYWWSVKFHSFDVNLVRGAHGEHRIEIINSFRYNLVIISIVISWIPFRARTEFPKRPHTRTHVESEWTERNNSASKCRNADGDDRSSKLIIIKAYRLLPFTTPLPHYRLARKHTDKEHTISTMPTTSIK